MEDLEKKSEGIENVLSRSLNLSIYFISKWLENYQKLSLDDNLEDLTEIGYTGFYEDSIIAGLDGLRSLLPEVEHILNANQLEQLKDQYEKLNQRYEQTSRIIANRLKH